jgi:hypothetical protein
MPQDENPKRFDLEDRTFAFAKRTRSFVKSLSKTIGNIEDARQLIRSSGSVGSNLHRSKRVFEQKGFRPSDQNLS